jgi:hypothetical protein
VPAIFEVSARRRGGRGGKQGFTRTDPGRMVDELSPQPYIVGNFQVKPFSAACDLDGSSRHCDASVAA